MNEPRVIVCAQCGNSWNEPLFIHTCLAVPRVAESLDDLAVGMVVAWETDAGRVGGGTIYGFGQDCLVTGRNGGGDIWDKVKHGPVVILADPPAPPAPEEGRPNILDDVDGDLDEIEQIAEARAQGYGYQPDTGSASSIQTHDDPYRNTRPASVPAPHADAENDEAAYQAWRMTWKYPDPIPSVKAAFMAGYLRGRGDRG